MAALDTDVWAESRRRALWGRFVPFEPPGLLHPSESTGLASNAVLGRLASILFGAGDFASGGLTEPLLIVVTLNLQSLHRPLITRLDACQRQMLINLQTLLADGAADELDLGIRHSLCCQPSEHLMAQQVRVNSIWQICRFGIIRHDLLNSSRGVLRPLPGFEQEAVLRVGRKVGLQAEAERLRVEDVPVFPTLPLFDENLTSVKVDLFNPDADELRDADRGVEQQLQHDFVLEVAALPDGVEEFRQTRLGQDLRQPAGSRWAAESEFFPHVG